MDGVRMWAVFAKRSKYPWAVERMREIAEETAEYAFGVNERTPGYRCVRVIVTEEKP